jgi:HSP20 family molecular chaperone IbpA
MADRRQLQAQKKREQESREEATIPARVFVPTADIYETQDALTVILEMPGVEKSRISVRVEDGLLRVEGRLDLTKYQGLQPLYTEYNVGHYARSFQLSSKIDQAKIEAALNDGVLSLTLPKVQEAKPRLINIS